VLAQTPRSIRGRGTRPESIVRASVDGQVRVADGLDRFNVSMASRPHSSSLASIAKRGGDRGFLADLQILRVVDSGAVASHWGGMMPAIPPTASLQLVRCGTRVVQETNDFTARGPAIRVVGLFSVRCSQETRRREWHPSHRSCDADSSLIPRYRGGESLERLQRGTTVFLPRHVGANSGFDDLHALDMRGRPRSRARGFSATPLAHGFAHRTSSRVASLSP
jgi:hypothetical protein